MGVQPAQGIYQVAGCEPLIPNAAEWRIVVSASGAIQWPSGPQWVQKGAPPDYHYEDSQGWIISFTGSLPPAYGLAVLVPPSGPHHAGTATPMA